MGGASRGRSHLDAAEIDAVVERLKSRIGFTTPATIHRVEAGQISRFARAVGEMNAVYHDEQYAKTTRFGALIAPPTFASCFIPDHFPSPVFDMDIPVSTTLHSHDVVENIRAIRVGDVLTARAVYSEVYRRDGKKPMLLQMADLLLDDAAGERVAVVRVASVCF